MIDWQKSYGQVIFSGPSNGVCFTQDGKFFNLRGEEVTQNGRVIEHHNAPDPLPSIEHDDDAAAESNPDEESGSDLMLIDRIKITDKNQIGYLEIDEIREELTGLGKKFHPRSGREKLLNQLIDAMGL